MKSFSDHLWSELDRLIDAEIAPDQRIAAFDADGTLWHHDAGETFFEYLIEKRCLAGLPPDPWAHYESLKINNSNQEAYLWLAQIFEGISITQVRAWAAEAVERTKPFPLFEDQKRLIKQLKERDFKIFIVTASVAWAVEPAARLIGLSDTDVLGIRTIVSKDGLVTATQEGPITYREGKPKALLQATQGIRPYFASGNTEGDLHLLECATHRLVIKSTQSNHDNYKTESVMQNIAVERGWLAHQFN